MFWWLAQGSTTSQTSPVTCEEEMRYNCDSDFHSRESESTNSVSKTIKWYDSSCNDCNKGSGTSELANKNLTHINKCGLQGKLKARCFWLNPFLSFF